MPVPAKLRQQIRLTPDLAAKVRQLAELWAGVEGPLTPSAVFRVAVERAWRDMAHSLEIQRREQAKR